MMQDSASGMSSNPADVSDPMAARLYQRLGFAIAVIIVLQVLAFAGAIAISSRRSAIEDIVSIARNQQHATQSFTESTYLALVGVSLSEWSMVVEQRLTSARAQRNFAADLDRLTAAFAERGLFGFNPAHTQPVIARVERDWAELQRSEVALLRSNQNELRNNPGLDQLRTDARRLSVSHEALLRAIEHDSLPLLHGMERIERAIPAATFVTILAIAIYVTRTVLIPFAHSRLHLRQARDHLDLEVRERTAELASANVRLRDEIAEHLRLEKSQQRLVAILEGTSDFVGMGDTNMRAVYLNRSGRALVGIPQDEDIAALDFKDFHTPEDFSMMTASAFPIATSDGIWSGESRLLARSGEVIPVLQVLIAHRPEGDSPGYFSTIIRDSRPFKRVENELRATIVDLARSNEELQQFAYVASHDLQEPLRAVSGCVRLLGRQFRGRLDDHADELIRHAIEGAERMQTLINDLLALSRVTSRGQAVVRCEASRAVATALADLSAAVRESGADIHVAPLPNVFADQVQLHHLFQNLIGNAIKYRSVERPLRIDISAEERPGEVLFRVSDNGIGIESRYFAKIFLVFQRLHTREHYPGTGIGLAVCKKIVERHDGRIWVESEPGKGSTFLFTIGQRSQT